MTHWKLWVEHPNPPPGKEPNPWHALAPASAAESDDDYGWGRWKLKSVNAMNRRLLAFESQGTLVLVKRGSKRYERRRKKIEARRIAQGRPPSLAERARLKAGARKAEQGKAAP